MIITYHHQHQTWFITCRQDLGIELCYEHLWSISRYGITYLMIFGSWILWLLGTTQWQLLSPGRSLHRVVPWGFLEGLPRCGAGGRGPAGDESHGGYPNSWLVFFMENPNLKWMITRGTPMTLLEKPPYEIYIYIYKRWNDFGDIIISPVLIWFLFFKALPMMMPCVQRFTNSTPGNLEGDRSREAILHAMRCQCRCHMSFQVTWMARHLSDAESWQD